MERKSKAMDILGYWEHSIYTKLPWRALAEIYRERFMYVISPAIAALVLLGRNWKLWEDCWDQDHNDMLFSPVIHITLKECYFQK